MVLDTPTADPDIHAHAFDVRPVDGIFGDPFECSLARKDKMLQENDLAPDFELMADDGQAVRLSSLRGQKVVLFFYPKASTPGCTVEASEFRDREADFLTRDAVVFGLSPDPIPDLVRFREEHGLSFPLLSDVDHTVAEAYGVWKEKSLFGNVYMGVERSTFVVDADGRVARAYRKVKPEGHAAEVLATL